MLQRLECLCDIFKLVPHSIRKSPKMSHFPKKMVRCRLRNCFSMLQSSDFSEQTFVDTLSRMRLWSWISTTVWNSGVKFNAITSLLFDYLAGMLIALGF